MKRGGVMRGARRIGERCRRTFVLVMAVLVAASCDLDGRLPAQSGGRARTAADSAAAARRTLALFEQELAVVELLERTGVAHRPCRCAFRHVAVVDVESGRVLPDMLVMVESGRIARVARDDYTTLPPGIVVIDGSGRYLVPGLADMHVHQLTSASQHLLHVANGVTMVRDMDGFRWMLEWRERSRLDEWLAPSMIVAGHILSAVPMGMHATVVGSPKAARRVVRDQHAAGYDYIKVHNVLPAATYTAILDEAGRLGVGVVGHVPHRITVAQAVTAGQETIEHLKGYIDDRTLRIAEDDWGTATRDAEVWNTPTLYTYRTFFGRLEAEAWLRMDEARYLPALLKSEWLEGLAPTVPQVARDLARDQRTVLRRLIPITHRFLAGTDAGGGYPFMVAGFALHEELRLLHESGMPVLEALRAATIYPARATSREREFGRIAAGLRADVVLLGADPLPALDALRVPAGVMIRGRWLDRAALDHLLDELARIQSRVPAIADDPALPDEAWLRDVLARVEHSRSAGYTFPRHHFQDAAVALRQLGFEEPAGRLIEAAVGPLPQ